MTFNTDEEIKEFLTNLGIQYSFGCLSEHKPEVCHLLGDYLESVKKKFSKAATVYQKNCDEYSYARSCKKYGNYLMLGWGMVEKNPKLAYDYYKRGCYLEDERCCYSQALFNLGYVNECTDHVKIIKGLKNLEKSCIRKYDKACNLVSEIYIQGSVQDHNIEKDWEKAMKYARIGCELRHPDCCANLSVMYFKGLGVQKDDKMAKKYHKMAKEIREEMQQTRRMIDFQQGSDN